MPKPTTINTQVFNADQSWYFTRIIKVDAIKLKVSIIRNAYDDQSKAKVYKWDGNQWHVVHSLPITDCVCKRISYVTQNITAAVFESDYEKLLAVALQIVL